MPILSLLFGLSLVQQFDSVKTTQPSLELSAAAYQKPLKLPYNDAAFANASTAGIIGSLSNDVNPVNVAGVSTLQEFNGWLVDKSYKKEPYEMESLYTSLYMDPSDNSVTFIFDNKATHLLPAVINQWNQGILNQITGDQKHKLTVRSKPFPLSNTEVQMVDFGVTLMTVILISMSYAFIPTNFASHIVTERESSVKHQQIIAGLGLFSYWIANLFFDLIIFMVPCIVGGIVIILFDIKLFTENLNSSAILLIFLLFGLSVITLTYLLSFCFKNPQSAQTILGRLYEISGLLLLIIGIMLGQFIPSGKYLWADVMLFVFRCLPNYAFGEGLFNATYAQQKQSMMSTFLSTEDDGTNLDIFAWDILGRDLCFMSLTTVVNLFLICVVEYVSFNAKLMSFCSFYFNSSIHTAARSLGMDSASTIYDEEDSDVINEKESIQNGEKSHNSSIEIVGLKKIFKSKKNNNVPKVAVNNLYFAVNESEIFGFLGSNGAGKSTTMKMLTKELVPTEGNAYFKNGVYRNNIMDSNYFTFFYESHCGYCPQNDGLIELLTGREHLELYCRIRGFDRFNTQKFVDILVHALNLQNFANGTVNKYSGGNRRKLCVGIALIGNPAVVMLDEPSTGIDPLSRRFMWNFISSMTRNQTMAQKRSVLLTTHSMEEAETLCDRIGIMDGGILQCLGSAQHLKTKYGDGYELYIKLNDNFMIDTKEKLKEYVLVNVLETLQMSMKNKKQSQMLNIKLIDDHGVVMRFSIRLTTSHVNTEEIEQEEEQKNDEYEVEVEKSKSKNIPLSKIFGCIESVKSKFEIVEYSVSQNTLEQVFLHLIDEEEEEEVNSGDATKSYCARLRGR